MLEAMTNHLLKRGSRYYIRRKIPQDLIAHYGRKEFVKALGTSDYAEACRRVREESVALDREYTRRHLSQPFEDDSAPPYTDLPPEFREAVRLYEDDHGVKFDSPSELPLEDVYLYWISTRAQRSRQVAASEEAMRRVLTAFGLRPGSVPLAPAAKPVSAPSTGHLAALVEHWTRERKPTSRTVAKANLVVGRFYEFVGRVSVPSITRHHVIAFKDKLLDSGQSGVNTNKQLEMLSILLNFARDNGMAHENPAHRVRVLIKKKGVARGKARISFDLAALQAIFSSPVYTEGLRPAGGAGEAAYWLPLLGLLTGARLEELCQLAPDDVFQETYLDTSGTSHSVWCVRFVDSEEREQGVKNAGSVRRIPVHPELLARGFLAFAHAQRGRSRIFHSLKANKHGEESAQWSKWFGKYLRATCGVTNSRMVFHSFRHGFKDVCRECSIGKVIADALQGHTDGDSSDAYGGEFYPLRPLVEATGKIRVAGLMLPECSAA